jgi:hypothetical protein
MAISTSPSAPSSRWPFCSSSHRAAGATVRPISEAPMLRVSAASGPSAEGA